MLLTGLAVLLLASESLGDSLDVCLQDLGCLRGTEMPGYLAGPFDAFLGIPFAQPPVGELRLKNPLPAGAWQGTLDAGAAKDSCLQKNYFLKGWPVTGVEDCLYLNVYRPKRTDGGPLPVMVYIHSGGFFSGSAHPAASGPEYLMDTGRVVVVTVSYRLGPFGFLSTGDGEMPGNFGLKDQRLALQWVQQHIASFGGNPSLVTILGHSAGGVSTHLHMLSPSSKGLFHRAMSLAGLMFIPATKIVKDPLLQARRMAKVAGIDRAESLTSQDLATALRAVDAVELLSSVDSLKVWDNLPLIINAPVVEPEGCPEAFFLEDPMTTHLSGGIHQVPWLLGLDSRAGEGALTILHAFSDSKRREEFNDKFLEHMSLVLSLPEGTSPAAVQEILDAYGFQGKGLDNDTFLALAEISGDFNFYYPLYETILSYSGYADLKRNPLSVYVFEFQGTRTFASMFSGNDEDYGVGTAHMDDGLHTIRIPVVMKDFPKDSPDATVVQRMTSLMTEFAEKGVFLEGAACQASDLGDQRMCNYLHFGGANGIYQESVRSSFNLTAFSLWQKIFV
ncbi:hypothetical protein KR018_011587 [Drosophila ironensis]|nr:hypothetical protein KR018_011587 [Drosophila ironensis]